MSTELKPCPFCGGLATEGEYDAYSCDSSFEAIVCETCDVYLSLGTYSGMYGTEAWGEARKEWNTRPIEDALRKENEIMRGMLLGEISETALARELGQV